MKQETVRHNVRLEWGLSETAWQEGEALLAAGLFRGAVARYYYAVFHGARAVLLSKDLEPSTPTGVRVAYTRTFVRPGLLPRETARILGSLQQERQDADYTRDFDVDQGDAEESRHDANAFRASSASTSGPTTCWNRGCCSPPRSDQVPPCTPMTKDPAA